MTVKDYKAAGQPVEVSPACHNMPNGTAAYYVFNEATPGGAWVYDISNRGLYWAPFSVIKSLKIPERSIA